MPQSLLKSDRVFLLFAMAALGVGTADSCVVASGTTQPANLLNESPEAMAANAKLSKDYGELAKALAAPDVLVDPQKRAELAKVLVPKTKVADEEADTLARLDPKMAATVASIHRYLAVYRAALDDENTTAKLQQDSAGTDPAVALNAKIDLLRVAWMRAGTDAERQAPTTAAALELTRAYPSDNGVTSLVLSFSSRAALPEVKTQLHDAAFAMDSTLAKHLKLGDEGNVKLNSKKQKPLTLAGKTPDGQDFSTGSFKGKVVLVDFWATWCGPCKAELPRVKEMYKTYHDKGLEVVGVSNDYSAKALTTFTKENGLPWPQLFNADAAADHEWNPITNDMGIGGIPVMVLIDKKGVCRSVTARADLEKLIPQLLSEPG